MAWRDWIADRIKEARVKKGLTQVELARQVSIYHQLIAKYESGRAVPSVDTVERIAQATGCSLDWFFVSPGCAAPPSLAQAALDVLARLDRAEAELAAARAQLQILLSPGLLLQPEP